MRRIFFWFVPLFTTVLCTFLFGYGFFLGVTGGGGSDVQEPPPAPRSSTPVGGFRIMVLGDSLARGAGDRSGLGIGGNLDAELKRRGVTNRKYVNVAVDGARTSDLMKQFDSANVRRLIAGSNIVVISIGGNDFFGARGSERRLVSVAEADAVMNRVEGEIAAIVNVVRTESPGARIFLVGLYNPFLNTPVGKPTTQAVNVWNSRLMRKYAADANFTVVQTSDLFSHRDRLSADRFHPSDEGYKLIARRIADAL